MNFAGETSDDRPRNSAELICAAMTCAEKICAGDRP
jgi:hypothetical protein